MRTVILAGGLGTRITEKTTDCPKPMIEVGGKPLLWHIMQLYSSYGYNDFTVALGYKGHLIKQFFMDYYQMSCDLSINLANGELKTHGGRIDQWNVNLVDTGLKTQTGGRIRRLKNWVGNETFMMTYGDGLSDVNLDDLVAFHKQHGRLATLTAVRPPARFGGLEFNGDEVCQFTEKPQIGEGWINGGFFILEPEVFDYIPTGDEAIWESGALESLAKDGQLMAYRHEGFWQPMDTLREHRQLEKLWNAGSPPWIMDPLNKGCIV